MNCLRVLIVFLFAFAPLARAQSERTPTLESAKARWERLSPQEQARMRERYERYKDMPEGARAELAERARRLDDDRARVERSLSVEQRARLAAMDERKRRAVIDDLVEMEARERGQRIREQMPGPWMKRLDEARPEDRARFFADFKAKARERATQAAIDRLGRRLELSRPEVERLKSLAPEDRANAVLELKKRLSSRETAEFGLPPGVTAEQWEAWQALPPEQFFEVMQKLKRERQFRDAERHADDARKGRGWTPERLALLPRLLEATRIRPEDSFDLGDLDRPERARELQLRRRARVLATLRSLDLLSKETIDELERVPPPLFMNALRHELPPPPEGHRPPREGGERPPFPPPQHRPGDDRR